MQEILDNIVPGVNEHVAQGEVHDFINIPDQQPVVEEQPLQLLENVPEVP